jgi:hypothetical protein
MVATQQQPGPEQQASRVLPVERRSAPRYAERMRILLREDRFATAGYTINISSHGALVRTSAPLRVGALYDLYIQTGRGVRHTAVKVMRALPHYGYAIRFEQPIRDVAVG